MLAANTRQRLWRGLISVALYLTVTACEETNPCDPGWRLDDGVCVKEAPPPKLDAGTDLPSDDGGTGADAAPTFGTPCVDRVMHTDCQGPSVGVCLRRQNEAMGICSAVCDGKPEICPTGWLCFDLSVIEPGAPKACVPQSLLGS